MNMLARLRWSAAYPLYAVALSAALFTLVSLSIALQPPDGDSGTLSGALEWADAVFFTGAAALFALGIAGYARPRPEPAHEAMHDDDVLAFTHEHEESLSFTLISVRVPDEEPAGIADFAGTEELLAAMRSWRKRYPNEELRVFGSDGVELARRAPADCRPGMAAVEEPASRLLVRRRVSPATGGV